MLNLTFHQDKFQAAININLQKADQQQKLVNQQPRKESHTSLDDSPHSSHDESIIPSVNDGLSQSYSLEDLDTV